MYYIYIYKKYKYTFIKISLAKIISNSLEQLLQGSTRLYESTVKAHQSNTFFKTLNEAVNSKRSNGKVK